MPTDISAVSLGVATTILGCGTIFRLRYTGLHRRFRVLVWFLCIDVLRKLALLSALFSAHQRSAYASVWVLTEPVVWISYILLVLDLYFQAIENYPGLRTVGHWVCVRCLAFSVLIAASFTLLCWRGHGGNSVLFSYDTVGSAVMFSLAVFMILSLSLLAQYPITWSRNMVVHAGICGILMINGSVRHLVRILDAARFGDAVNLPSQLVTIVCVSAWLVLLKPTGQQRVSMWQGQRQQRPVSSQRFGA